jgi:hypothetical protein
MSAAEQVYNNVDLQDLIVSYNVCPRCSFAGPLPPQLPANAIPFYVGGTMHGIGRFYSTFSKIFSLEPSSGGGYGGRWYRAVCPPCLAAIQSTNTSVIGPACAILRQNGMEV